MINPDLPAGYHVENLTTLLHAVVAQYEDLLDAHELELYQRYSSLSSTAKSLYYRLLTRRGQFLRQDKLNYDDIPQLNMTLAELCESGMASSNHAADPALLLGLLTRPELIQHFKPSGHSKLNKQQLLATILEQTDSELILETLRAAFPYVEAHYQDAFETFQVCFFGNNHQDLSEFVIRDLGHVQYENYSLCRQTRYFQTRQQLQQQMLYSSARQQLDDPLLLQNAHALIQLAHGLPAPDHHPHLQRRYQKAIIHIARQLERLQCMPDALQLYQRCDRHPSRERQIRILKKQGDFDAAMALCRDIAAHGQHPEELEFAQRFLPQLQRASGLNIQAQKRPEFREFELVLPKTAEAVEHQAAAALTDDLHIACYVENTLFNGLFGLFFWDIIFTATPGAFINAFQRGPLDLSSEDFYLRRQPALNARLAQLRRPDWQTVIRKHYAAKQGIANPFVVWEALTTELLELALLRIPAQHLQSLFQRQLYHPGLFRNGFPDLIRFSQNDYELIEVKAPGDTLQANQIRWLKHFQQYAIPACVCWVHWDSAADD